MANTKVSALTAATSLSATDEFYVNAGGTSKKVTFATVKDQVVLTDERFAAYKNKLVNGDFSVGQRGVSFTDATTPANNDDTILLDRWLLLSDGNNIADVAQNTASAPTNGQYCVSLTVTENNNKKFGLGQIIEYKNVKGILGETVTFSFKAKVSETTKLSNIKAVILSWDGTADAVTSDFVSAWGTGGTTPTWATNWTAENTPANLNVTNAWVTYSVSGAIDTSGTKNVAVFVWSDVIDTTAGHLLYLADMQLEPGAEASTFEVLPTAINLELCQRYYEKSYNLATVPGTAEYDGTAVTRRAEASETATFFNETFRSRKRAVPTVTWYSARTGTSGKINNSAADITVTGTFASHPVSEMKTGSPTHASSGSAAQVVYGHWTADAEL